MAYLLTDPVRDNIDTVLFNKWYYIYNGSRYIIRLIVWCFIKSI